MLLSTILFPEEAKAFEIKEALRQSCEDSQHGRAKSHKEVMASVCKKLRR